MRGTNTTKRTVGENDWRTNWIGIARWLHNLEWSGVEEFAVAEYSEWGGLQVKSANGLTFAKVRDAGHMVAYDRPWEALQMANQWFARRRL